MHPIQLTKLTRITPVVQLLQVSQAVKSFRVLSIGKTTVTIKRQLADTQKSLNNILTMQTSLKRFGTTALIQLCHMQRTALMRLHTSLVKDLQIFLSMIVQLKFMKQLVNLTKLQSAMFSVKSLTKQCNALKMSDQLRCNRFQFKRSNNIRRLCTLMMVRLAKLLSLET